MKNVPWKSILEDTFQLVCKGSAIADRKKGRIGEMRECRRVYLTYKSTLGGGAFFLFDNPKLALRHIKPFASFVCTQKATTFGLRQKKTQSPLKIQAIMALCVAIAEIKGKAFVI